MTTQSLNRDVAQMVMPRLDGEKLGSARYMVQVHSLIREGIGGFILFGGSVERTPDQLQGLQELSEIPLLIASDVERGLGQQLAGGTRFPSQRAVASAISLRSKKDLDLLNRMLDAVRIETRAAGIHAVFSPVIDVNSNADNPITRLLNGSDHNTSGVCKSAGGETGLTFWPAPSISPGMEIRTRTRIRFCPLSGRTDRG
jgi:beta-glucosidase-like glycosyl hydrolase